jgi:hypothetical protein
LQLPILNRSHTLRVDGGYCPNRVELPSCHIKIYVIGGLHNFQLNTPPCCSRFFIAIINLQTDAYIAVPARDFVPFTTHNVKLFIIFAQNIFNFCIEYFIIIDVKIDVPAGGIDFRILYNFQYHKYYFLYFLSTLPSQIFCL